MLTTGAPMILSAAAPTDTELAICMASGKAATLASDVGAGACVFAGVASTVAVAGVGVCPAPVGRPTPIAAPHVTQKRYPGGLVARQLGHVRGGSAEALTENWSAGASGRDRGVDILGAEIGNADPGALFALVLITADDGFAEMGFVDVGLAETGLGAFAELGGALSRSLSRSLSLSRSVKGLLARSSRSAFCALLSSPALSLVASTRGIPCGGVGATIRP